MVLPRAAFFNLFVACTHAAKQCFLPGGMPSKDTPCDPTAEVSMCCGNSSGCLSNGLCRSNETTSDNGTAYARGTCTDPSWQSPICPQNCRMNQDTAKNSSAFDFRWNGVQVWECDAQGYGKPAAYCCESDSEKSRCCSTTTALFHLPAATSGNALSVQAVPTTTPTAQATSTTSTTGSGPFPTSTSSATVTSTGTSSQTAAPDTPAMLVLPDDDSGDDLRRTLVIGIGASIGSAFFVGLGLTYLLRRKHQASKAHSPSYGPASSSSYGDSSTFPSSEEKCVVITTVQDQGSIVSSDSSMVTVSPTSTAITRPKSYRYLGRTYELA